MVTHTAKMKDKGQITVPVEIRRQFDLHSGSRLVFEVRDGFIALLPAESMVDRLAGSLADYAKNGPVVWDRDELWTAIASERWDRLQQQPPEDTDTPASEDE